VVHACHFSATIRAFPARFGTFLHIPDLVAILRACVADLGAQSTKTMLKRRASELEIGRGLTDLGAAHQQTEVLWFHMFAAGFETVVQRGLQADLMAMAACIDTGLHGVVGAVCVTHGLLLRQLSNQALRGKQGRRKT
jgi:hypothetical protein